MGLRVRMWHLIWSLLHSMGVIDNHLGGHKIDIFQMLRHSIWKCGECVLGVWWMCSRGSRWVSSMTTWKAKELDFSHKTHDSVWKGVRSVVCVFWMGDGCVFETLNENPLGDSEREPFERLWTWTVKETTWILKETRNENHYGDSERGRFARLGTKTL
jgi:hypothetical protein